MTTSEQPVDANPCAAVHSHGRITHAHAHAETQHTHPFRAICSMDECAGWETHDIHVPVQKWTITERHQCSLGHYRLGKAEDCPHRGDRGHV